jgi:hypothetical protein
MLDVLAQTVTATLHYLKRGPEKPARYVAEPPPGVPVWSGEDDPRQMTIADARGLEGEFTIDRNGFQLVKAPTCSIEASDVRRWPSHPSPKSDDLRAIAGVIIPASMEFDVPGAEIQRSNPTSWRPLAATLALRGKRWTSSRALPGRRWPVSIRHGASRWVWNCARRAGRQLRR